MAATSGGRSIRCPPEQLFAAPAGTSGKFALGGTDPKTGRIRIAAGDTITVETPGGCGDPGRRDPALVARDVARGYYTAAQATQLFPADGGG